MASIVALAPNGFLDGTLVALTPPELVAKIGEAEAIRLSAKKINLVSADSGFFTYLISERYAREAEEFYKKTQAVKADVDTVKTAVDGLKSDTQTFANNAQASADNAKASELKAKEWAIKDTAVEGNDFSSKYYANESKNNKDSAAASQQAATAAATKAEAAANSIVNPLVDKGQFDPRGGNYPAKPNESAVWYVIAKGNINGVDWDVGDFLTYSKVNDQFSKITGDPVGTTTPQPFSVPDDLIMNPKKAIRFKETPTDSDPMYAVGLQISQAGDKRLIIGDKDNAQQTELTLFNYDANKIYAVEAIQGADDEPVKKIPMLTGKNGYLKTEIDSKLDTKVSNTGGIIKGTVLLQDAGADAKVTLQRTDSNGNINIGFKRMDGNTTYFGLRSDGKLGYGNSLDISGAGASIYSTANKPTAADLNLYTKTESDGKYALQDQDSHSVQYARWLRPQSVNLNSMGTAFKSFTNGDGSTGFPYTYGSGFFVPRESGQHHYGFGLWQSTTGSDLRYFKQKVDGSGADFYTVYHSGNKPTPSAIGTYSTSTIDAELNKKVNKSGGTMTGRLTVPALRVMDSIVDNGDLNVYNSKAESGHGTYISAPNNWTRIFAKDGVLQVQDQGAHINRVYHQGYKPSAADVGAYSKAESDGKYLTTAGTINYAYYSKPKDERNTNNAPNKLLNTSFVGWAFKANSADGFNQGGTYHGIMSFRPYGSNTDTSGGGVHQLAFGQNSRLGIRYGTTAWGSWDYLYSTQHKPTKADVGLSNVPNYAFTYAVNDSSKTKFASAYGVKLAYDKAVSAYLPQTWKGGVGNNADSYTSGCKVGFSYGTAGKTPYAGTLISLHSQSGYGTQFNTVYSGGNKIAFRTYNGDHKVWNPWHRIYHDADKPTPNEIGAQPHHAKLDGLAGSLTDFGGQDIRIRGKRALVGSTGNLLINYSNDFAKTEVMSDLQVDKNITASANITAYSDERLKDNVKPLENALDKVNKIGGYSYERNDLDGAKQVGVLAQEIEKVLPEVVDTNEEGYKSVAYGNISALLIEAIKDLSKENKDLQERLEKLEGGI